MINWADLADWVKFLIQWGIGFGLGLLFRKRVGRWLVKAKKWLFNDFVATTILSVRSYTPLETPVEVREFSLDMYEEIEVKITNLKRVDLFPDGMRLRMPTFGVVRLGLSEVGDEEDSGNQDEMVEKIKLTLQPESPVRLGIREVNLLDEFAKNAEILFNSAAGLIATRNKLKEDYTILEFPRVGLFVEEKTFELEDKNLGVNVHATPAKLTMVVAPTRQIAKAAGKYLLS